MVENFICRDCQCENVCLVKKKLMAFDEDAKTQLGTDIRIDNCENFKPIKKDGI